MTLLWFPPWSPCEPSIVTAELLASETDDGNDDNPEAGQDDPLAGPGPDVNSWLASTHAQVKRTTITNTTRETPKEQLIGKKKKEQHKRGISQAIPREERVELVQKVQREVPKASALNTPAGLS
jgi:hypothetical protein